MWLLGLSVAIAAPNADGITAIEQLSLRDLLDLDVDVATRTLEDAREAAGLVTVLTADDLRRAGCRDLLDAFRLLPSFELGVDSWNGVGLAIRGNWALESKVLVLIDGHEWNETDYGTFTLGNRLPAYAIERIEVVRGPGSAVYGGYASLAVVKVTTRAAGDDDGTRIDARTSWLGTGVYGGQDLGASVGYTLRDDVHLGITGVIGRGRRTDDVYRDVAGQTLDLTEVSALDPTLVTAELRAGDFEIGAMFERYHTTFGVGYGFVLPTDRDSDFTGVYTRASWKLALSEEWSLTPRASFKWQQPWHSTRNRPRRNWSANQVDRTVAGLDLHGAPSEHVDLLIGGEAGVDRGHIPQFQPDYWFDGGPDETFLFGAAWGQGIVWTRFVNLTTGLRLDANNAYGQALSPRIALTRALEMAHAKLQLSRAFRAPGFQQSSYDVKPEQSTTLEAELGFGPTRWAYIVASAYEVRMTNAMVFVVANGEESYTNVGRTGSRGGELSVDVRVSPVSVTGGYAVYTGAGLTDPATDRYRVPGHPGVHLGLPTHKGVTRASVDVTETLSLGTVGTVLGPRWAITGVVGDSERVWDLLRPAVTLDLSADLSSIGRTPFGVTVGVHDLLDAAPAFVQPYDALHAPLPSRGREIVLQLTAQW